MTDLSYRVNPPSKSVKLSTSASPPRKAVVSSDSWARHGRKTQIRWGKASISLPVGCTPRLWPLNPVSFLPVMHPHPPAFLPLAPLLSPKRCLPNTLPTAGLWTRQSPAVIRLPRLPRRHLWRRSECVPRSWAITEGWTWCLLWSDALHRYPGFILSPRIIHLPWTSRRYDAVLHGLVLLIYHNSVTSHLANCSSAFIWKLCCYWLKGLQVSISVLQDKTIFLEDLSSKMTSSSTIKRTMNYMWIDIGNTHTVLVLWIYLLHGFFCLIIQISVFNESVIFSWD